MEKIKHEVNKTQLVLRLRKCEALDPLIHEIYFMTRHQEQ